MINDSFWSASATTPVASTEPLSAHLRCDVAVIGGGFTGLSAALHLAESGCEVIVVEAAGEIAAGASGRNGGQVNPGLKLGADALRARFGENGWVFYRMGQEAPDFLSKLVARLGIECDFKRNGLIRLAHSSRALSALRAAADTLASEGAPVEWLSVDDIKRLVGTTRYEGGLLDRRGASVQPLELARGLARAAQERNVRIFTGSRATAVEQHGGSWIVTTQAGKITSREVIVATNGYSDAIVPGLAKSLIPVNSFQIATAPLPGPLSKRLLPGFHTVYDSRRLVLYFRRSPDGRVIIGGRASFSSKTLGADKRADYSVLENVLTNIFPELKGFPVTHRWTGLVCVTADFLPHYHVPRPGMHVLLGFNGRGVAMSNRAGAWLANRIAGKEDTGWMPETPIKQIPFHSLREPMLNVAMQANRILDIFGY